MLDTPILFLIFNRPDTTIRVFKQIKAAKPKKLFIAADGPRKDKSNDFELCMLTRSIVNNIDWDCEVKTLFREENLGCGIAICEAITWFFDYVEQGIILEDDCLPHPTFFKFCENMLNYFKDDLEVFNISGSNNQFGRKRGDGSYYFSKYGHIWGWATWRHTWQGFDRKMPDYLNAIQYSNIEPYWKNIFYQVYNNENTEWDYQWFFYIQKNRGKVVVPNQNLIFNIGFDTNATHTTSLPDWYKNYKLASDGITNIIHPSVTKINKRADDFTFKVKFKRKITFKYLARNIARLIFTDKEIQRIKSLI